MSHRAGVRAAAPIPIKDFQESDLILYVAYFLKGSLGPPSSCPWLAVSRDACATSLNVAAERLESRFKCITEAAQRKRKTCRKPQRPRQTQQTPRQKKAVQTQVSSRRGVPRRETFNSFSEGRELDWTLSGLLELLYGCWGC